MELKYCHTQSKSDIDYSQYKSVACYFKFLMYQHFKLIEILNGEYLENCVSDLNSVLGLSGFPKKKPSMQVL